MTSRVVGLAETGGAEDSVAVELAEPLEQPVSASMTASMVVPISVRLIVQPPKLSRLGTLARLQTRRAAYRVSRRSGVPDSGERPGALQTGALVVPGFHAGEARAPNRGIGERHAPRGSRHEDAALDSRVLVVVTHAGISRSGDRGQVECGASPRVRVGSDAVGAARQTRHMPKSKPRSAALATSRPRLWVWLGVGVAGFLALTVLVALTPLGTSGAWVSGIQAASTVSLLVVTLAYVVLTYRLVLAQENPLSAVRMQQQHASAMALAGIVTTRGISAVSDIKLWFPLDSSRRTPPRPVSDDVRRAWFELERDIEAHSSSLPPELFQVASVCYATMLRSQLVLSSIWMACAAEAVAAANADRDWSYESARREFVDEWERSGQPNLPDFDDVATGQPLERSRKALQDLYVALHSYLMHPER